MRRYGPWEIGAYLTILGATVSGNALAQSSGVGTKPIIIPAEQSNEGAAVGDIIVTAEKRTTSLNRVGVTMAAISGEDLKKQSIQNVRDLSRIVPGLVYTESPSSTPVYTLRGVGFYEVSLAAYPDVSVYVDQVPLPFPALTPQAGLDLERVEVLKGPQGILFGQNSTGGAINYIAAKPTDHFAAGADFTFGRFNRVEGNGYISGPLTGNLRARLALKAVQSDDWQYRYTPSQYGGSDTSGGAEEYVGRLLLDWTPTEKLSVELSANGSINKTDPQASQFFAINIQNPGATAAIAKIRAVPFAPHNARAANWSNHMRANDSTYQFAGTANLHLSEDVTLTSITAYNHYKKDSIDTGDGLPFIDLSADDHDGYIKSFTQELRLANDSSNSFRWTVGGNLEKSHVFERQHFSYADGTLPEAFGLISNYFFSDQKMSNYAVFGNGEYDITRKLTVKGGARATWSKRKFSGCGYDDGDGRFAAAFSFFGTLLSGQPVSVQPGECFVLDAVTSLPHLVQDNLNENNVSWRAGIDFRATPSVLLYANIAQGYKAGSFPTLGASTTQQYAPVVQESLLDYEAGFKAQLLDRTVTLSGAAFYYDYKNKQVRTKLIDNIFGVLDALGNVPKSHVIGAELSLAARPIGGLTISAATTFLHSVVDRYTGVDLQSGSQVDYAGVALPFSPKWQSSLSADYDWSIGAMTLGLGGTVSQHSGTTAVVGNSYTHIDAYVLLDLRASLSAPGDRWKLSLFGKNVTDKYYWTNVIQTYDVSSRYAGLPATFGVNIAYRY